MGKSNPEMEYRELKVQIPSETMDVVNEECMTGVTLEWLVHHALLSYVANRRVERTRTKVRQGKAELKMVSVVRLD